MVLTACAVARQDDARPVDPAHPQASELFRAAVLDTRTHLRDNPSVPGAVLLVDPRAMAIDEFRPPAAAAFHDGTDAVIAERLAVLADLGIDTAAALPVMPDCQPLMAAPPGQRVVHGCPPDYTIMAVLDTVRAGTEPGTWVLPRLPIAYRPGYGRVGNVSDMVVGRRDGAYVVLEQRTLGDFER